MQRDVRGLEEQAAYWMEQMSGKLPVVQIPPDYPRPPTQAFTRSRQFVVLEKKLSSELTGFCLRENVSLFTLLISAFKLLLHRYTGVDDIIVGSLSSDSMLRREEKETERFTNVIALRTNLAQALSFREILLRVVKTVEGAAVNRDFPFEELMDNIDWGEDLIRQPIPQPMFILRDAPFCISHEPILERNLLWAEEYIVRCDLFLLASNAEGVIEVVCEYDVELYRSETISRMLGHFLVVLEAIVTDPGHQPFDFPLLTENEQRQVLVEWNNTLMDYDRNQCVHDLFETQVERSPDVVAVALEDEYVTYRALNHRANQLAHYLQALGVGPETLVGIYMERSLDMVVGLLGILKAGGAYVSLDPTHPKERLDLILNDIRARVLLTQNWLIEKLADNNAKVICLDADWPTISAESEESPATEVTGDNLAYVIYTSGSTGMPKGVQIPHSALTNFLQSMQQQPGLTNKDVLLAVTTLSFDIAALEIFLPIIVGARVIIASYDVASNGVRLSRQLADAGVTVMQATPITWQLLLAAGWQGSNTLRRLCGGEALARNLANQLLERGGELWNMYGPTETTIWSTIHHVEPSEIAPVSIGRPIANTQTYLLDHYLQPVPIGVPGELYIGGDGVARGYLNRPELTAERFIPDPFSDRHGGRLYKTGDLARYLPNGNIEFLGRYDQQVKIRGFRIELGEIETALSKHAAVKHAAVVSREDTLGNMDLVAYLVSNQGSTLSINEIRRFIKKALPDYMIPSAYVFLDALPLTPNGKVDRHALPAPSRIRPELEAPFAAPQTSIQRLIVKVWQDVLKVKKVGIHDNFFDLGGNSLLMAEVQSKLGAVFDKDLTIDMFKYPTVYSLVSYLSQVVDVLQLYPDQNDLSKRVEDGKNRLKELRERRQRGANTLRDS